MTDVEQRADRLVRDVAIAMQGVAYGTATMRKAKKAVVVALREVIRDIDSRDLIGADVRMYAEELGELADVIENGGSGD